MNFISFLVLWKSFSPFPRHNDTSALFVDFCVPLWLNIALNNFASFSEVKPRLQEVAITRPKAKKLFFWQTFNNDTHSIKRFNQNSCKLSFPTHQKKNFDPIKKSNKTAAAGIIMKIFMSRDREIEELKIFGMYRLACFYFSPGLIYACVQFEFVSIVALQTYQLHPTWKLKIGTPNNYSVKIIMFRKWKCFSQNWKTVCNHAFVEVLPNNKKIAKYYRNAYLLSSTFCNTITLLFSPLKRKVMNKSCPEKLLISFSFNSNGFT